MRWGGEGAEQGRTGRPGSKATKAEVGLESVIQDWETLAGRITGWEQVRDSKRRPCGVVSLFCGHQLKTHALCSPSSQEASKVEGPYCQGELWNKWRHKRTSKLEVGSHSNGNAKQPGPRCLQLRFPALVEILPWENSRRKVIGALFLCKCTLFPPTERLSEVLFGNSLSLVLNCIHFAERV